MGKRINIKTVNKKLKEEGMSIELIKGEGYFYFFPIPEASEEYHNAVVGLEHTSVYVYKLNDQTLEQWLCDAKEIHDKATGSIERGGLH